uniref:Uncharacterized protein n=1 Tax=Arundo donax TaxID=35708 RepID=A0A0A9C2J6_ARUDO
MQHKEMETSSSNPTCKILLGTCHIRST